VYLGKPKDAELLASAYRSCLTLCSQHGIKTVAFPSISTGVYGYPIEHAAPIAIGTVRAYLTEHSEIRLARFVLFDARTFAAYQRALAEAVFNGPIPLLSEVLRGAEGAILTFKSSYVMLSDDGYDT